MAVECLLLMIFIAFIPLAPYKRFFLLYGVYDYQLLAFCFSEIHGGKINGVDALESVSPVLLFLMKLRYEIDSREGGLCTSALLHTQLLFGVFRIYRISSL